MRLVDLLVRPLLVVGAAAAVLTGAGTALTTVLVALAAVAVVHRLASRRVRGGVDAVLAGVGGLLTALVLVGFALDLSGIGLRPRSWAVGLAVLGLLALAATARRPVGVRAANHLGRPRARDLPWLAASVVVVGAAISLSAQAVDRDDVSPVAMSLGSSPGSAVRVPVTLTTGSDAGPFELRTQGPDGNTISYPLVTLQPGRPVTTTVLLPVKGRYVITLNNPGQDAPVRTLTVDR